MYSYQTSFLFKQYKIIRTVNSENGIGCMFIELERFDRFRFVMQKIKVGCADIARVYFMFEVNISLFINRIFTAVSAYFQKMFFCGVPAVLSMVMLKVFVLLSAHAF